MDQKRAEKVMYILIFRLVNWRQRTQELES